MLVGRPFHNGVLDTLFAPPLGGLARLLGGLAGHFFLGPVGALCAYLPPAGVRRKHPPNGSKEGRKDVEKHVQRSVWYNFKILGTHGQRSPTNSYGGPWCPNRVLPNAAGAP